MSGAIGNAAAQDPAPIRSPDVWSFAGASTVDFSTSVIEQENLRAGISPEREREVLAAWRARKAGAR